MPGNRGEHRGRSRPVLSVPRSARNSRTGTGTLAFRPATAGLLKSVAEPAESTGMDPMAIVDLAQSIHDRVLRNDIATAVARKMLDAMQAQGAAVVEMLEAAADQTPPSPIGPSAIGTTLDLLA